MICEWIDNSRRQVGSARRMEETSSSWRWLGNPMTLIQRVCSLCIFAAPTLLIAQSPGTSTPAPQNDKGSPVLFGTNGNVEGGVESKGDDLGLGDHQADKKKKKREGEFAIAPIPVVNPSIGNGGGLIVLYAVPLGKDEASPPSTFAAGGFATAAGSIAIALGTELHLKADRYRVTLGVGGGRFNYNYFGTGEESGAVSIPLSQRSNAVLVEPKIRFFRDWYAGPRYHIITSEVGLNSTTLDLDELPIPLPSTANLRTAALGIRTQRDSTDSKFYPQTGSIFDALVDFYAPQLGGVRTYQNLTVSYDKFLHPGKRNVLAIRGSACLVTEEAPFYDICLLGFSKDIRGYQIGQFRDDRMLVGQMEFRRELFWRVGAVAFAGAGAVAHTWSDFGNTNARPGGGFGLRCVLAKRNHINLRVDFAWGQNSRATYVSLGEAF